jgi:protein-L-isoaspartate(D-aspartate) O-methyltransferase
MTASVLARFLASCLAIVIAILGAVIPVGAADAYDAKRRAMVQEVASMGREVASEIGGKGIDERVLAVMARVPRHAFVPAEEVRHAYENRPLPIGHGQTISQPYIVALMTDLARIKPGHKVLEIGTGSGYQAAILADITPHVYSIEIVEPLAEQAEARLRQLGYPAKVRLGDGYYGWPEHGPFDAILVTAAASHIPPPLVKQLKPGGRMVVPVGAQFLTQYLTLVEKKPDGSVVTREILPVRFVPLTGGH